VCCSLLTCRFKLSLSACHARNASHIITTVYFFLSVLILSLILQAMMKGLGIPKMKKLPVNPNKKIGPVTVQTGDGRPNFVPTPVQSVKMKVLTYSEQIVQECLDTLDPEQRKKAQEGFGKVDPKAEATSEQAQAISDGPVATLSYKELVLRVLAKDYKGLNHENLDLSLSDAEFLLVFVVDREEFAAMPAWRRDDLKKKLYLY
jgi:hypothetical protein